MGSVLKKVRGSDIKFYDVCYKLVLVKTGIGTDRRMIKNLKDGENKN